MPWPEEQPEEAAWTSYFSSVTPHSTTKYPSTCPLRTNTATPNSAMRSKGKSATAGRAGNLANGLPKRYSALPFPPNSLILPGVVSDNCVGSNDGIRIQKGWRWRLLQHQKGRKHQKWNRRTALGCKVYGRESKPSTQTINDNKIHSLRQNGVD